MDVSNTLEELLREGQRLYYKVSDADFNDDSDRRLATDGAARCLEALHEGIGREGVFSSNEEIDDISTETLPLLLSDYFLGSLITKLPFGTPEARLQALRRADTYLCYFLERCEKLELLNDEDKKVWHSVLQDADEAGVAMKASNRDDKIRRFRRQKRIRDKMKALDVEVERAPLEHDGDPGREDEARRENNILMLKSSAIDAIDEVLAMNREKEMLQSMLTVSERKLKEVRDRAEAPRDQQLHASDGLEVTHITRMEGSLQVRKENVRASVFQPTVALPTITVEQFGEIEMERARTEQQARSGETTTTRRRYDQLEQDGDEDDEELVEKAAQHDREWDDWKDEHPRGYGNKANKII